MVQKPINSSTLNVVAEDRLHIRKNSEEFRKQILEMRAN